MKTTYNEILESMKAAYHKSCGKNPDALGDVSVRFQAVASELYSLACNEEYLINQAFPQTATGKHLDYHAELRGIERKVSSKARVLLTFSISEALSFNITIPANTICASNKNPYIQFSTMQDTVLKAGSTSVSAYASSVEEGAQYNVSADEITVIVTAPTRIEAVTNKDNATGGKDDESDESLRRRILTTYKVLPTGVTLNSISEVVESIPEVLECRIFKNGNVFSAYVKTIDDTVSSYLKDKIFSKMEILRLMGGELDTAIVNPVEISIVVNYQKLENSPSDLEQQIKSIVKASVDKVKIGGMLELINVYKDVAKCEGLIDFSVESPNALDGTISVENNQYLILKSVEVNNIEQ